MYKLTDIMTDKKLLAVVNALAVGSTAQIQTNNAAQIFSTADPTLKYSWGGTSWSLVSVSGNGNAIEIPGSVTEGGHTGNVVGIAANAFNNYSPLDNGTVSVGENVAAIGDNAFANILYLTITFAGSVPPTIGETPFETDVTIKVPSDAVDAYKAAWGGYTNNIEASSGAFPVTLEYNDNVNDQHAHIKQLDEKLGLVDGTTYTVNYLFNGVAGTFNCAAMSGNGAVAIYSPDYSYMIYDGWNLSNQVADACSMYRFNTTATDTVVISSITEA